jgi:cyclopropane fatty-acyl-phospholipid synthase-like methyltransferase
MELSFTEIFKYTDILNPVSPTSLLLAGNLARLEPGKTILDLGSGKGYPSLLWASAFGVQIDGFEINRNYVEYANARARMLNLANRVNYSCQNIQGLKFRRKYDVIASLGLGISQVYGGIRDALESFKAILDRKGVLIFAEPVWSVTPVPQEVLKGIGETEDSFPTKPEMQKSIEACGFKVLGDFVSSKEDWELYVKPTNIAMNEIVRSKKELAGEARKVMNGFKAEYNAANKYWDMILWVAEAQ